MWRDFVSTHGFRPNVSGNGRELAEEAASSHSHMCARRGLGAIGGARVAVRPRQEGCGRTPIGGHCVYSPWLAVGLDQVHCCRLRVPSPRTIAPVGIRPGATIARQSKEMGEPHPQRVRLIPALRSCQARALRGGRQRTYPFKL